MAVDADGHGSLIGWGLHVMDAVVPLREAIAQSAGSAAAAAAYVAAAEELGDLIRSRRMLWREQSRT